MMMVDDNGDLLNDDHHMAIVDENDECWLILKESRRCKVAENDLCRSIFKQLFFFT